MVIVAPGEGLWQYLGIARGQRYLQKEGFTMILEKSWIDKYPFLDALLREVLTSKGLGKISEMTVDKKVADGVLMYREAKNAGWETSEHGPQTRIFSSEDERKDQVARRRERAFLVSSDGQFKNLHLPTNKRPKGRPVYLKTRMNELHGKQIEVFEEVGSKERHRYRFKETWMAIEYIVWVTTYSWYERGPGDEFIGEAEDFEVEMTVYSEPPEGFFNLVRNSNEWEHLTIGRDTFIDNYYCVESNPEITEIGGALSMLCELFEKEVYERGLRAQYDTYKLKGASAKWDGMDLRAYEMCGYQMFTLDDNDGTKITFQTHISDGVACKMYVKSSSGTLPKIRELVVTAMRNWADPEMRTKFAPDKHTTIG